MKNFLKKKKKKITIAKKKIISLLKKNSIFEIYNIIIYSIYNVLINVGNNWSFIISFINHFNKYLKWYYINYIS